MEIEKYNQVVLTSDMILDLMIEDRKKIVNPWLSESSIILLSGWRGTGKSWFCLSLLDSISRAKDFGPWEVSEPFNVLYLDGESALSDLRERILLLEKSNLDCPKRADFLIYSDNLALTYGVPRANLRNSKFQKFLKTLCLERKIKVLCLDNLSVLAPGLDENLKKDFDFINQFLVELRFEGISIILIHHTGKGGDQRGSSAHEDQVDISISLFQPFDYHIEDGARFIVKFKKARLPIEDLHLIQDCEFKLTKDPEGRLVWIYEGVKKKNRDEILRLLGEGMPTGEIAQYLNVSKPYVSKVKAELIKSGLISENGKLTPKGNSALTLTFG